MVFFTCNKCGDSLKKKDVAKHVGKCRGSLALTCVDCHKDFYEDEYIAHTSCITEAEKYGVKGFKSRAPSTAGVSKQEEWMQAVLMASEASGLSAHQRSFLTALNRHGNVPRKQKQFQNFARNVWRESFRQTSVVEQVFSMIESELKKIKGPPKENGTAPDNSTKEHGDGPVQITGDLAIEVIASKKCEEKKDRSLVESKVNEEEAEEGAVNVIMEENSSKKSKKKKHKKKQEETTEAGLEERTIDVLMEENTTKKSKKKKHKRQNEEVVAESKQNGVEIEEQAVEVVMKDSTCGKKSKKKKEKEALEEKMNGNGIEKMTEDTVMGEATNKKSKKNKHKRRREETADETKENGNEAEERTAEILEDTTGKKIKKKKHKQVEEEEVPRKKSKKSKQT